MDVMRERDAGRPVLLPESMLYACVLPDLDTALLQRAAALQMDGVRWVHVGNVAAFVAGRPELACDAARRVVDVHGADALLPAPLSGLQHEAHYVWPLSPNAFTTCEAIARVDGDFISLWTSAPPGADLLAKLVR